MVKVARRGAQRTRVILSNGVNELVSSQYDPPIAKGDKVILCPPTNDFKNPEQDAVFVGLSRMKKEGRLPDHVIEYMNKLKTDLGKHNALL